MAAPQTITINGKDYTAYTGADLESDYVFPANVVKQIIEDNINNADFEERFRQINMELLKIKNSM